jgi:hypothetical protein
MVASSLTCGDIIEIEDLVCINNTTLHPVSCSPGAFVVNISTLALHALSMPEYLTILAAHGMHFAYQI